MNITDLLYNLILYMDSSSSVCCGNVQNTVSSPRAVNSYFFGDEHYYRYYEGGSIDYGLQKSFCSSFPFDEDFEQYCFDDDISDDYTTNATYENYNSSDSPVDYTSSAISTQNLSSEATEKDSHCIGNKRTSTKANNGKPLRRRNFKRKRMCNVYQGNIKAEVN